MYCVLWCADLYIVLTCFKKVQQHCHVHFSFRNGGVWFRVAHDIRTGD